MCYFKMLSLLRITRINHTTVFIVVLFARFMYHYKLCMHVPFPAADVIKGAIIFVIVNL